MDTGKVRFVFRNFAFLGPESFWAAEAAECAADQGRFWEYHDLLYANQSGENQGAFNKNRLKGLAANLALDLPTFYSCLDSDATLPRVQEEIKAGQQLGVNSTPTLMIQGPTVDPSKAPFEQPNGFLLRGAPTFDAIRQMIEQELAR